jgi:hypothetical protein
MITLFAPTEDQVLTEKTDFSADEAIGQTVLSVDNNQGFIADDYIILGRLSQETSELAQVYSVSSDLKSITIKIATRHSHFKGDPITKILYNQRKFYRSTSKTGTFSHLSTEGSPVDIEVDKPDGTIFEDTTGSSTSWYKSTYFNTESGKETSIDDAIPIQAGESNHYTSLYKIKLEAGLEENYYVPIDIVDDYRNEAENQAESSVVGIYSVPFSSAPKIFEQIVRILAAGLLLTKEYGLEADINISKTGERKIQRAESLLQKIKDGVILLVDQNNSLIGRTGSLKASSSNAYDGSTEDKGELFNIGDEHFSMKDPDSPKS